MFTTIAEAEKAVGGLSTPSKMPSYAWNISAKRCMIGSLLVEVNGSVCNTCYALKGRYVFPTVQTALERRYIAWLNDRKQWIEAMIYLMHNKGHIVKTGYFRWFDSGDLQGIEMLKDIIKVACASPHIKFWLPTKEYKLIRKHSRLKIPDNLIIRVSNPYVNKATLKGHEYVSTVFTKDRLKESNGNICPSSKQGNKCDKCRWCWSKIKDITYIYH
jgi:hypothetical protein